MDIKRIQRQRYLADLNARMLEKDITQQQLGEKMGVRQGQISLWLNGSVNVNLDTLVKLTNLIENWGKAENLLEEESIQYSSAKSEQTLGYLIKKNLKSSGMNQKELADKVGTSQSRISEYIRGAVAPSLGVAARICRELRIDADEYIDACSRL